MFHLEVLPVRITITVLICWKAVLLLRNTALCGVISCRRHEMALTSTHLKMSHQLTGYSFALCNKQRNLQVRIEAKGRGVPFHNVPAALWCVYEHVELLPKWLHISSAVISRM